MGQTGELGLRYRHVWLAAWVMLLVLATPNLNNDWVYLDRGADLLFQHGLEVYAAAPRLQIGPLALAASWPVPSAIACTLLVAALFPVNIWLLEIAGIRPAQIAVVGPLAAFGWALIARSSHLDDALAVTLLVLAVAEVRPSRAVLWLVLAVWAKPWAIVAMPLLLTVGWVYAAAGVGGVLLTWLPFLAGGGSVAGRVQFLVEPWTLPAVLGWEHTAPWWWRAAQLAACLLVAGLAWQMSGSHVVPAVAVAARVWTDPGDWPYMAAPLLLLFVLLPRRWPAGVGAVLMLATMGQHGSAAIWGLRTVGLGLILWSSRPKERPERNPGSGGPLEAIALGARPRNGLHRRGAHESESRESSSP